MLFSGQSSFAQLCEKKSDKMGKELHVRDIDGDTLNEIDLQIRVTDGIFYLLLSRDIEGALENYDSLN